MLFSQIHPNMMPLFVQQGPFNCPLYPTPAQNPEVIGEGEIATIVCPDGSIQFYFVPTSARWMPNATQGANGCTCNSPNRGFGNGAWYITRISNPVPLPPIFTQQYQNYNQDALMPNSNPVFPEIKFHNDGWTSTTDIHYFFPSLRGREWVPKAGACVQAQLPATDRDILHYEFVTQQRRKDPTESMLVDEDACPFAQKQVKVSPRSAPKSVEACPDSTPRGTQPSPDLAVKKETADKSVTTYCDESVSCACDGGSQTQKVSKRIKKKSNEDLSCACDSESQKKKGTKRLTKKTKSQSVSLCCCESKCSAGKECGCYSYSDTD